MSTPKDDFGESFASLVMRPAARYLKTAIDLAKRQRLEDRHAKGNLIRPTGIGVGQSLLVRERPLASFHQSREGIQPSDRVTVRIRLRLARRTLPHSLGLFPCCGGSCLSRTGNRM